MQLSVLLSISLSLPFSFMQSPGFSQSSSARSPRSPCSPTDTCKVLGSFSSRPESQGGQTNQEHNEKVLLNLEEVKVSRKRNVYMLSWDAVNHLFVPCLFGVNLWHFVSGCPTEQDIACQRVCACLWLHNWWMCMHVCINADHLQTRFCVGAWRSACGGAAVVQQGRSQTKSGWRSRLRGRRALRVWMNLGCPTHHPSLPPTLGPAVPNPISTRQTSLSWTLGPRLKVDFNTHFHM